MRKRISAMLLVFAMVITTILSPLQAEAAQDKVSGYEVIKPDNYDSSRTYPVVYIMPENGYKMDNSGMAEKFQAAMEDGIATDMILVKVAFDKDTDLHAAMENLVNDIDSTYSTIKNANGRAVVGTGVGGYLAYILGLTEKVVTTETVVVEEVAPVVEAAPVEENVTEEEETTSEEVMPVDEIVEEVITEEAAPVVAAAPAEETVEKIEYKTLSKPNLFKYIASTRGDFVSEDNGWYAVYGDVSEYVKTMGANTLSKFYTYLDAPARDKYTDMKGSTDDIGHWILGEIADLSISEFTVRSGSFTNEFFTESVNRIAERISSAALAGTVSGSVSLTKAALTQEVEKAEVKYNVNMNTAFGNYASGEEKIKIRIDIIDPNTNEVLATEVVDEKASTGKELKGTVEMKNLVNGTSSTVQLSVNVLGVDLILATTTLTRIQDTVVDGEYQYIDLMGDWYFHFNGVGNKAGLDVEALLSSKDYEKWPIVQPALAWWTQGFGDVQTKYPYPGVWDYGIIGDGYYVRTFEVPENFDADEIVLSVGYMDDRGEAYINGKLVGATGMENGEAIKKEDGTIESAWTLYSAYEIDPSVLNIGGTNTIVVRCQNDGDGGGGWYAGPVAIYSKEAFESSGGSDSLFKEYSFDSQYAATAQGKDGTVENKYLVYLPEGYEESDKHYPTLYLLHQFNSDHTSYEIDNIDGLVNEAIKQALIDEMIVIVPNSSEMSFWTGNWEKMVTEELVPLVDSQFRTIQDARYRFTAGCSMGGQGAMGVALSNPNLFSGATSFFGAFSYAQFFGATDPRTVAKNESKDYLDYYSWYFICGNLDNYTFGQPAIDLHQLLLNKNVEHEFFIDNGEHNSAFYVPHFIEGVAYIRDNMYKSDEAVEKLMSGELVEKDGKLYAAFEALAGIEKYFNNIPASSYTKEENPNLNIPLIVRVTQNGETVYEDIIKENTVNAKMRAKAGVSEYELPDLSDVVDMDAEYTVTYSAAIFDRVVELDSKTFNSNNAENPGDGAPGEVDPEAGDSDVKVESEKEAVKTGDEAPVMMYSVIALMALAVVVVAFKKRRG